MSKADRASVFAALGDPVRLNLLSRIGDGRSITELAAGLPITRQAVTRHLRVLERAKLVEERRRGRETRFVVRPARLRQAKGWLDDVAQQWDGTLGRLKAHIEGARR
ncbi:MAG: metalloregulator ArsR/SmtB family transcription factor [Parvularculaceae bacterium]